MPGKPPIPRWEIARQTNSIYLTHGVLTSESYHSHRLIALRDKCEANASYQLVGSGQCARAYLHVTTDHVHFLPQAATQASRDSSLALSLVG